MLHCEERGLPDYRGVYESAQDLFRVDYSRSLGCRIKARKRGSRKETELPVSSVRSGMQSAMSLGEPFDELVLFEFHLQG